MLIVADYAGKFDRCPKAWERDEAAPEADLFADVVTFRRFGALPKSGGMHDQDPQFLEALNYLAAEEQQLAEEIKKRYGRKRTRQANDSKPGHRERTPASPVYRGGSS